jgi:hypothetical protein
VAKPSSAIERVEQGRLIDHTAARHVDEVRARLGHRQHCGIDQMAGCGVAGTASTT